MDKIIKFLMGDKAVHFLYSFVITVSASTTIPIVPAMIIPNALGLAKELWMDRNTTGFNKWDMLANLLGSIAGGVVAYLLKQC